MPDYRIYEIGEDGHVVRLLIELTLDSDVIAIAYAEQLPTVEAIAPNFPRRMNSDHRN
jgi:hypothetical protein